MNYTGLVVLAIAASSLITAQQPSVTSLGTPMFNTDKPTVTVSIKLESGKLVVISRSEYQSNVIYTSYPARPAPPTIVLERHTYGASNGVVVLESIESGKEVPAITVTETKTIAPATNIWTKIQP